MHYLATVEYIYTYGYETAGERTRAHTRSETVYDQRRWRGHEGGEKQTTGAEECETEYEPVEAGLRDEGGSPTFSVRQQELGGKANLDGPDVSLPRSMKTVTGPNWLSGRLSSGLQRPRYQG